MSLLLVVTVVKNDNSALLNTGESLKSIQGEVNWYVKNGGEAFPPELRKSLLGCAKSVTLIEGADLGIYNAMNEVIDKVELDKLLYPDDTWIIFLNAGDLLFNGEFLLQALDEIPRIYCVAVLESREIGQVFTEEVLSKDEITFENFVQGRVKMNHQSIIIRTAALNKMSPFYDETYRFASDFLYIMNLILQCQMTKLNSTTLLFDPNGISAKHILRVQFEKIQILFFQYLKLRKMVILEALVSSLYIHLKSLIMLFFIKVKSF